MTAETAGICLPQLHTPLSEEVVERLGEKSMPRRSLHMIVHAYGALFLATGVLLIPILNSLFALAASAQGSSSIPQRDAAIFSLLAITCLGLFAIAAWGVWRRAAWGRIAGAVASSMCMVLLCIVAFGLLLSSENLTMLALFGITAFCAMASFRGIMLFGRDERVRALFPEGELLGA